MTPTVIYPPQEKNLAEAAEALRDELELVDYVTGHDLQAPLRAIQHCGEALGQPATDSERAELVHTLNEEALRLKTLMQGMRDYIRLETFSTTSTPLDCTEIAQTAKDTLEKEIKAAGATIIIDSLPTVLGHRGRLTRLFALLLDNALKFHGDRPPHIHISAKRCADGWEFCVKDNGIGINEEYYEIIFRLFQRLHSEAYAGHGIGLALAHKIIGVHGGKIWVESEPGQGSRFYFILDAVNNA